MTFRPIHWSLGLVATTLLCSYALIRHTTSEQQEANPPVSESAPAVAMLKPGRARAHSAQAPLVAEAPAQPADDLPTRVARFEALGADQIEQALESLDRTLADEQWVERANAGALSSEQQQRLRLMLRERNALSIVKANRIIAAAADDLQHESSAP